MKKVLFVATITRTINAFLIPYLKMFKEQGYEVHVASNGDEQIEYCDKHFNIQFARFPIKPSNLKAYKELKKIINENDYKIIHCHTPVAGVLTRLAARKARKNGSKVFYTAHGFHFYKGAPKLNWIIYYPIEKICARWTDCLITINSEDYERAKRKFKKCKRIEYVPGVGIDRNKFEISISEDDKDKLRKSIGIKIDDFIIIYPAEISSRKRQVWLINAISSLLMHNFKIHLLLPGSDSLNGKCNELIKRLKLENQIHLLGYRKDIPNLLKISNLAVSSSKQEGLPVNIMEAMYDELPLVVSNCRGNRDLVKSEVNGFVIDLDDEEGFSKAIIRIIEDKTLANKLGQRGKEDVEKYILNNVMIYYKKIYRNC